MAIKTVTRTVTVPTFTDGAYHMNAVLIDCQGNVQVVELMLSDNKDMADYFAPCPHCGVAVLDIAYYGGDDSDCCARCGITMPDNEAITLDEAKRFFKACGVVFGGGFHPDTLGESYVHGKDMERTFTDEEAMQYDENLVTACKQFEEAKLCLYTWYALNVLGEEWTELEPDAGCSKDQDSYKD